MRLKKAVTYWFYSICVSFAVLYCIQHFVLNNHKLTYVKGFAISSFVELCIVIGLYDNIPNTRLRKRLETIKKVHDE